MSAEQPAGPMQAVRAAVWGRPALVAVCVAACLLAAGAALGLSVPTPAPWALLAGLLGLITLGVVRPASGVFGRPVLGARGEQPWVALTFDDGPHPSNTLKVMDMLDAGGHRGTFFVVGHRAAQHPKLLSEIARRGHLLANHTWRHVPWTPALPVATLGAELGRLTVLLDEAQGRPTRWFRPPVGLLSPPVWAAAQRAGLQTLIWTAAARDGVPWADPQRALGRLLAGLRPGAVLVLHDGVDGAGGRPHAVLEVLPRLLKELERRGLRSVTLDELLP